MQTSKKKFRNNDKNILAKMGQNKMKSHII